MLAVEFIDCHAYISCRFVMLSYFIWCIVLWVSDDIRHTTETFLKLNSSEMREKYSNLNWNLGCWNSKNHFIRKFICHKILSTHRHTSTKSKRKSIDFTTKIPKMICFYLYVRLKINITSIETFRFYFHGYT